MKLLQVNAVNELGSTGRAASELSQELARRGIESLVAHAAGPGAEMGCRIGTPLDHKAHALMSRLTGLQAYHSRRATMQLLRYIQKESPDVIHLRNLHANYIHLPMLLGFVADRDIPTVLTLDDCWYFTGHCCHYTADGCYRWLHGCGQCPRLRSDNPSWFFDRTQEMWADKRRLLREIPRLGVIGVSDWITNEAARSFLQEAAILRRIHNWIDLDNFSPARRAKARLQLNLEDKHVLLGVASRWSTSKGLHDFLRLGDELSRGAVRFANGDCSSGSTLEPLIVLVGSLPRGTVLPGNVRSIEPTSDIRALADFYAAADVFLQLSREETFGKVVAESLACGTPAVVYDSTANAELIGPGCGYAVAPGDLRAVVGSVHKLARTQKSDHVVACRAFSAQRFGMRERVDEHLRLYDELRAIPAGAPR